MGNDFNDMEYPHCGYWRAYEINDVEACNVCGYNSEDNLTLIKILLLRQKR